MTVEQFGQMQTADTEDYELVQGELIPLPSATPGHNIILDEIMFLMLTYFKKNLNGRPIAGVDCRLSFDTVRRPDVSVFLTEKIQRIDMNAIPVQFAPDIAVEVLSPSDKELAMRLKIRDYLRAGTAEVWLVDNFNNEVMVHTSTSIRALQEADLLESPLLPGFSATVASFIAHV